MPRNVTSSNNTYPSYLLDTFKGGVFEPENHAIKIGLARAGYVPDDAHTELTDITDEVFGNGYSRQTLVNVTITEITGWIRLLFDPVQFAAVGGNLAVKYWFMFDDTPVNSPLMAWGQVDINKSDEIIIVDTFTLDLNVNELGLYRVPT